MKRTGKKTLKVRADELLSLNWSKIIKIGHKEKLYNFEYFMNRAYAFNRDKGKCRVCKEELRNDNIHIHHINPKLPLEEVNRVPKPCINARTLPSNDSQFERLFNGRKERMGKDSWF